MFTSSVSLEAQLISWVLSTLGSCILGLRSFLAALLLNRKEEHSPLSDPLRAFEEKGLLIRGLHYFCSRVQGIAFSDQQRLVSTWVQLDMGAYNIL